MILFRYSQATPRPATAGAAAATALQLDGLMAHCTAQVVALSAALDVTVQVSLVDEPVDDSDWVQVGVTTTLTFGGTDRALFQAVGAEGVIRHMRLRVVRNGGVDATYRAVAVGHPPAQGTMGAMG